MPAHYNLRNLLRQLSRELLSDLFDSHSVQIDLDLSALKKRQIEPIFAAITALPDDQRHKLDDDFRQIFALATPAGITHIIDEARFRGIEIVHRLRPIASPLDKAAWARVRERSVFESAVRLAVRDTLSGRYWKRRLPIGNLPGVDLAGTVKALEAAISSYFTEQEGRGKACLIEYLKRGSVHHFFAFPEDFPASPLAWTAQGLGPHTYRLAFEVVFIFDNSAGSTSTARPASRLFNSFIASLRRRRSPSVTCPTLRSRPMRWKV
jgi:hypothetical protein